MCSFYSVFSVFVPDHVIRLIHVMLFSDSTFPFAQFLTSILMLVLAAEILISGSAAIEQLFTAFSLTVTAVKILCVIELFQAPVVSPVLCKVQRLSSFQAVVPGNAESIAMMCLFNTPFLTGHVCSVAVGITPVSYTHLTLPTILLV